MFERYLEGLDVQEIMDMATRYGRIMFLEGERNQIKKQLDTLNAK